MFLNKGVSLSPLKLYFDKSSITLVGTSKSEELEKHVEVVIWTEVMKDVKKFKANFKGSTCHLALVLAPEMLIALDLPTFKGSPRYEVPTRPQIIFSRSPNNGWQCNALTTVAHRGK